tara:strand:- start:929 stop:1159 length:231 start_codon:yes stop_codon:yes gene_type:complete
MPETLRFWVVTLGGLGVLFFLTYVGSHTTPPLNTFIMPRFIYVFWFVLFLFSFVFFVVSCRAWYLYVFTGWGVVNG